MRWILCLCFFCQVAFCGQSYVTYSKSGGRFGDNLLVYLQAKWLAMQNGLPLLFVPFNYSSELVADDAEMHFDPASYCRLRRMTVREGTKIDAELPLLYECPYFPAFEEEQRAGGWYAFVVDWKDPEFRKEALAMIAPKRMLDLVWPKKGAISVAIHVREGGGFDTDHTRLFDPLKLPPLPFYVEALSKVIEMFPEREFYCYVFTDAMDTKSIATRSWRQFPQMQT